MLVFLQPKCQKYQKEHEGTGLFAAYAYVIFDFSGVMRRGRAFGSGFSVTTVSTDVDDGIGFGQYNSKNRFGKRFGNSKSDEASIIKWERMNSADSGKMESEGIIENDSKKDLDKELENMEMEGISLDGIDNIDIEGLSLGGSSDPEMERNTTDGIGNLVMEGIPEVMMDVDVDMNETRRISRVSFLTDASGDATNPESAESATIGDVTMQGYPEEIVDVDVKVKEKRRTPRVTFSVDVSGDATTTEVP